MKYIQRNLEKQIIEYICNKEEYKKVLLIEGARQVGKTTVIEEVLKKIKKPKVILNLEKHTIFKQKIDQCKEFSDFELLLKTEYFFNPESETILFIDESQESRKLGSFVRFMKEEWKRVTTILTGSTLSRLFRKEVRYPVGRVTRQRVTPFTFCEFLDSCQQHTLIELLRTRPYRIPEVIHHELMVYLDTYITIGGMPYIVTEYNRTKKYRENMAELLADYEQDFIRIFGETKMSVVNACFSSVANYVGSPSKNTSVIPQPTTKINHEIKEVFAQLEDWKLILKSNQYGISPEQNHKYLPKRYLFDTGIVRYLRDSAVPSLSVLERLPQEVKKTVGGIIENQTAIEISRFSKNLSGWKRTPSGMEIDFIASIHEQKCPIECKSSTKLKKSQIKGLREYLQLYKLNKGIIVSLAPYEIIPCPGGISIINIPLYLAEFIPAIYSAP